MAAKRAPFEIAEHRVNPGERRTLHLDLARLYTHTRLDLDVEVIHGRRPGPTLLISATIHGDELNGVEICRQLLKHKALTRLRGTLIVVPVVNIFGFIQRSRYLPDRRDLNRCFPGSEKGSLGSRVAHLFRTQVLAHASHVIDLHTGAAHRSNLPQIRANLSNPDAEGMAQAFGAPVILDSKTLDGSMRECADEMGIPLILYEAGEALRFDDSAIRGGLRGILRVLRHLEMLPPLQRTRPQLEPVTANSSYWVRAHYDGIYRPLIRLGQRVTRGQVLGLIASPFGNWEEPITATHPGILIGRTNIPLVNEGDALFHIARFGTVTHHAQRRVEAISEAIGAHRLPEDQWNSPDK
ncbi:succinylglutamate desuccinylase/aspartoacylase family protein [Motiliproteus sp. SC1-56]|uniref:succinylglutamate desuccinylase/aspartoacylase family protein n=1 Tax=Motiliproteus sp. SC1-56 TaxID=2799565 RepID=UPI001A8CA56B|nr:succinylglutamate desuccinylase/aspartoacylase family protein [Motiliproteus sp. SC1-56]